MPMTISVQNATIVQSRDNSRRAAARPRARRPEPGRKEGADPRGTTPEQFSVRIKSEIEKWGRVIKDANIKMN